MNLINIKWTNYIEDEKVLTGEVEIEGAYGIHFVFFNFSDGNFADDGRIPQDFFKILGWSFVCHKKLIIHMPYPSVLDFLKIKLEKSNLTNWIFSLFWTGLLPPA